MLGYKFTIKRNHTIVISVVLALIIVIFNAFYMILNSRITCEHPEKLFIIPKGASAGSVAELLQKRSCLGSEGVFKLALTITMKSRSIRPGRYDLKGISSVGQLIKVISSPSKDRVRVTLVEGWSLDRFAEELEKKIQIDTEKFLELCNDADFIEELNIDMMSLEGFLFPDTYILLRTYTEEEIIKVFVNQFLYNYEDLLNTIDTVDMMSMREITTLASIIQGEAIFDDEMPTIASVYYNRLDSNMLLQADPTIQYIIPGKPRRLFNKDLNIDNPYNTYKYKGLPPGPINNPGLAAIKATLEPKDTDYYYFVSDGEGRHIFTMNNEEHNKAKLVLKRKRRIKRKF